MLKLYKENYDDMHDIHNDEYEDIMRDVLEDALMYFETDFDSENEKQGFVKYIARKYDDEYSKKFLECVKMSPKEFYNKFKNEIDFSPSFIANNGINLPNQNIYVTLYIEDSISGPEEGGYTSYGMEAISSKKFDSYREARIFAKEYLDDNAYKILNNPRDGFWRAKDYDGEEFIIAIENDVTRGSEHSPALSWSQSEGNFKYPKPKFHPITGTVIKESFNDYNIEYFQNKVDNELKAFGRIGGKLYDELDDNGFYIDINNKVKYKKDISKALDEDLDSNDIIEYDEFKNSSVEKVSKDMGFAELINDLIRDEYEAIDGYNKAIALAKEMSEDKILNSLLDIQSEEHVHVGQLQELLKLFDINAHKIENGVKEAEEQLSEI